MARTTRKTDELDAIIDELGAPTEVTTSGPSASRTGAQDVLTATKGLLLEADEDDKVRTKRRAIEWGRDQMEARVDHYRGLCLMFVRMCFNIDPLYPDAITAWNEALTKHRTDAASDVPRGHAVFWRGGEHGHVALALGNGRVLSNDTGAPGTINVATIDGISRAWGYELLGWSDDVNGVTAPAPRPVKRPPTVREQRVSYLRAAVLRARANGHFSRARFLRRWIEAIQGRETS